MRNCLDGKIPVPAPTRLSNETLIPSVKAYKRKYPEHLLQAIDWAMEIKPEKRPQSVEELQQALVKQ